MKRIVITYGLIAGTITAALMLIAMPLWEKGIISFDNGHLVGYTSMVIALSVIFFGVKTYRDKHSNGVISFGKGVAIGLLISLIAAVMYSAAWEISLTQMSYDFIGEWTKHELEQMTANGATEAQLQEAKQSFANMQEYYNVPVIRFTMTMTEILPVGIVITLISAALLRKKEFLPATQQA